MTAATPAAQGKGERFEGVVQVLIMLTIGGFAAAASFTHVHDVAVDHGQPNWIGWADATVVELMSIALGLELRRRARTGRPTLFVLTALMFFIAVSLAAQVVDAEHSIMGWLAAALPAIGFLTLVKVALTRTTATTAMPIGTISDSTGSTARKALSTAHAVTEPAPAELLTGARIVADSYRQATGHTIAAGELADRLTIAVPTAERLLAALNGHRHTDPVTLVATGKANP